jgi:hypothetical protein
MNRGNWVMIDKRVVSLLPKTRAFTEIEALLSLSIDVDNLAYKTNTQPATATQAVQLVLSQNSISGYASLWGWSRHKTRKFINDLAESSGHVADRKGTGRGHHIRLIINNLQLVEDGLGTGRGQVADTSNDPIILKPKSKGKRLSRASLETEAFTRFYDVYPKQKNRTGAMKEWNKLKPSPELVEVIMTAIDVASASDDWKREGGRYIPHPSKWLNGKRWEDQIMLTEGEHNGPNTEYPIDIEG